MWKIWGEKQTFGFHHAQQGTAKLHVLWHSWWIPASDIQECTEWLYVSKCAAGVCALENTDQGVWAMRPWASASTTRRLDWASLTAQPHRTGWCSIPTSNLLPYDCMACIILLAMSKSGGCQNHSWTPLQECLKHRQRRTSLNGRTARWCVWRRITSTPCSVWSVWKHGGIHDMSSKICTAVKPDWLSASRKRDEAASTLEFPPLHQQEW